MSAATESENDEANELVETTKDLLWQAIVVLRGSIVVFFLLMAVLFAGAGYFLLDDTWAAIFGIWSATWVIMAVVAWVVLFILRNL